MKFFEMVERPNLATFLALNFSGGWFMMQPFFLGQTWLYAMSIFDEFGTELEFVGFSQERIVNIIMNLMYNMYN